MAVMGRFFIEVLTGIRWRTALDGSFTSPSLSAGMADTFGPYRSGWNTWSNQITCSLEQVLEDQRRPALVLRLNQLTALGDLAQIDRREAELLHQGIN